MSICMYVHTHIYIIYNAHLKLPLALSFVPAYLNSGLIYLFKL